MTFAPPPPLYEHTTRCYPNKYEKPRHQFGESLLLIADMSNTGIFDAPTQRRTFLASLCSTGIAENTPAIVHYDVIAGHVSVRNAAICTKLQRDSHIISGLSIQLW